MLVRKLFAVAARSFLLIAVMAVSGCSSQGSDEEVAASVEAATAKCTSNSQCSVTAPVCSSGACVQCSATSHALCKGATPICDPATAKCVACPGGQCPLAAPTCGLSAAVVNLVSGNSTTLNITVAGATNVSIDQSVGQVTTSSVKVTPKATTKYTLTAVNYLGSCTASATINIGTAPVISSFSASPTMLVQGQGKSSTLSWKVTGATSVSVDHNIGAVTSASVSAAPATTTTYTLTASNAFGQKTATATVSVGALPVINRFWAGPLPAGPGVNATLNWDVSSATTLSIDHSVGKVTGTSTSVSPTTATTYTLTASNSFGTVTATAAVAYMPLSKLDAQTYASEHVLFLIPSASQVTFTGTNSWGSVYSTSNTSWYTSQLNKRFPSDYFMVVVIANNLLPNNVPSVLTYRHVADGIGMDGVTGVGVPNICRYNIGGGTVIEGSLGVLDHEIGHNWGVFIGTEVGWPHWFSNSTVVGQMSDFYSDDDYATLKHITGDLQQGFTWYANDNVGEQETETFADQDLYAMGLSATFPDVYVLGSPVYHADHTVQYATVNKYDQAWLISKHGPRNPTYQTSPKRLRIGFVYVARNLSEVTTAYQQIEHSANQFVNAEQVDTRTYRFQVPFLVDTKYRASLDGLLVDLDGNRTPSVTITSPTYQVSKDGTATVNFIATDPDGVAPVVTCVPASVNCTVANSAVRLTNLPKGTNFFTIKAQDGGGKRSFAHFVVDVP